MILANIIYGIFEQAITVLQTLVIALGADLGIWGVINLLEGYGNDNPGANAQPTLVPGILTMFDKVKWLNEILEKEEIIKPIIIGQSMGEYVVKHGDRDGGF